MSDKTTTIKKNSCIYCGNHPTNHALSYGMESLLIVMEPGMRLLARLHFRFIDRIVEIVSFPYYVLFRLLGIWNVNKDPEKAPTERTRVIWREAIKRGISMEGTVILGKPIEQHRAKINGSWHYFESLPFPPNYNLSLFTWIDDKWQLKNFLRKNNVPVPYGRSVSSTNGALQTVGKGRAPFIIKPRLGSRGRHTTTHIYNESQLRNGFGIAQKLCHFVIVEEQLFGSVYRGTYVGGEVVGILRGDPPRITGDGKHTIEELIRIKNSKKHRQVKDVIVSPLLVEFLQRQKLSLQTVLKKERVIDVSEKIGISYGGFAAEELPKTHPRILEYIKKAGDALKVPIVGFDFIIGDITKDPDTQRWGIIEANTLPFIDLHHDPIEGKPINVAAKIWDLWK